MKRVTTFVSGLLCLCACASSGNKSVSVVVPAAESNIIYSNSQKESSAPVTIVYERDNNGQIIYSESVQSVTVFGGDRDTQHSLSQQASENAINQALQEVNGTLINDVTRVQSISTQTDSGSYDRQDLKSNLITKVLGIGKVKSQSCATEVVENNLLKLTCKVKVAVPVVSEVKIR